jgi:hypothetical protein
VPKKQGRWSWRWWFASTNPLVAAEHHSVTWRV